MKQQACVLAIGNFDGIHLGHQYLIKQLLYQAKKLQLKSIILTFEPMPKEYFSNKIARLSNLREKHYFLRAIGIDQIIVKKFNKTFANLTAQEFIDTIIIEQLNSKVVITGQNFCFGHHRLGNTDYLAKYLAKYQIKFIPCKIQSQTKLPISSTLIRNLLARNDLTKAEQLLNHRYFMLGKVIHGKKLGRKLGFPTANIKLNRKKSPLHGIYAVLVYNLTTNEKVTFGVASIGTRPTINAKEMLLEVHLFDFNSDIYFHTLKVEFITKIREEKTFSSLNELKNCISADIVKARKIFNI